MSTRCIDFVIGEDDKDSSPCHCPACGGFLPNDFSTRKQFLCPKCGAVLETLPSKVEDPDEEEDVDYEFGGRICIVPKYAVKIDATLPSKPKKEVKKKTNFWALCREGFRRVFKDGDGKRFIELYEYKIGSYEKLKVELTDPRILKIIEDVAKISE